MLRTIGPAILVLLAGCYGPGIMGWGSNGTQFEVMRDHGYIEVTAVGQGAMKAVPSGASPEYTGERTRWDEFALQFDESTKRIEFNRAPTRSSPQVPADQPFPLSTIASGEVELGQRLYVCTAADTSNHRFGVVVHGDFGGYNLWFDNLPLCEGWDRAPTSSTQS